MKHDAQHECYNNYVCPDPSHAAHPKGIHVLLCEPHKTSPANIALSETYKEKIICKRSNNFEDFTKNISLVCVTFSFHSASVGRGLDNVIPDVRFSAIFMLQTIIVDGVTLRLFFDTGCGDIVPYYTKLAWVPFNVRFINVDLINVFFCQNCILVYIN